MWHFQNVINKLQIKFSQFADQKKSEMVPTVQIAILQGLKYKLMVTLLDNSEICSIIQRLNPYNLLTDRLAKKVPWAIYRPDIKSAKSIGEREMNFAKTAILNSSNINLASFSVRVKKNICIYISNLLTHLIQFTLQFTIYKQI